MCRQEPPFWRLIQWSGSVVTLAGGTTTTPVTLLRADANRVGFSVAANQWVGTLLTGTVGLMARDRGTLVPIGALTQFEMQREFWRWNMGTLVTAEILYTGVLAADLPLGVNEYRIPNPDVWE